MIIKRGRFGTFLACTGYPDCKTTRRLVVGTKKAKEPDVPIGEKCPTCGGELLRRDGKEQIHLEPMRKFDCLAAVSAGFAESLQSDEKRRQIDGVDARKVDVALPAARIQAVQGHAHHLFLVACEGCCEGKVVQRSGRARATTKRFEVSKGFVVNLAGRLRIMPRKAQSVADV